MTNFEKKQASVVFVNAGKTAFKIRVEFRDNPYKQHPYKMLWEKGYMTERKKYDRNREREFRQRQLEQ